MTLADDRRNSGAVAVITGASQGIGREMAQQLACLGHTLVMIAQNSPRVGGNRHRGKLRVPGSCENRDPTEHSHIYASTPDTLGPFLKTPSQEAITPVWVATAPELANVSGKLFGSFMGNPRREFKLPVVTRDPGRRRRLIELLSNWSGLKPA